MVCIVFTCSVRRDVSNYSICLDTGQNQGSFSWGSTECDHLQAGDVEDGFEKSDCQWFTVMRLWLMESSQHSCSFSHGARQEEKDGPRIAIEVTIKQG